MFKLIILSIIFFVPFHTDAKSLYQDEYNNLLEELQEFDADKEIQIQKITSHIFEIKKIRDTFKKRDTPEFAQLVSYWVTLRLAFYNFENVSDCSISRQNIRNSYGNYQRESIDDDTILPEARKVEKILDFICD